MLHANMLHTQPTSFTIVKKRYAKISYNSIQSDSGNNVNLYIGKCFSVLPVI